MPKDQPKGPPRSQPPKGQPRQEPDPPPSPDAGNGLEDLPEAEPGGVPGHPPGNGYAAKLEGLERAVMQLGATQDKVIRYLQNEEQKRVASGPTFTQRERRDLLDKVVDPPQRIMPSLSNIPPLMAFLIPAMDVIKFNYIPRDQWPIDEETGRRMTLYDIWERSYYLNSLGKEGKHSIRMAGVAETRSEVKGFGIQAD